MSSVSMHIVLSGRVQGVGFRYFARKHADLAGISGWVKNRGNGQVELEISGESEHIGQFLDLLKEGPPLARVDNLSCQNIPTTTYDAFIIR